MNKVEVSDCKTDECEHTNKWNMRFKNKRIRVSIECTDGFSVLLRFSFIRKQDASQLAEALTEGGFCDSCTYKDKTLYLVHPDLLYIEYGNMVQTVKVVLEELDYEIENDFIY